MIGVKTKFLNRMSVTLGLIVLWMTTSLAQTTNQQNSDRGAYTTSVPAASDSGQTAANPGTTTSNTGNLATAASGNTNPGYGAAYNSTEPHGNGWGWIGLLGLGGLFGLSARRKDSARSYESQSARQRA